MRTRDKSKAQLLREVKELREEVISLEQSTKQALHREDAALKKYQAELQKQLELLERIKAHEETGQQLLKAYNDLREESKREEQYRLQLQNALSDVKKERDGWRRDFLAEQARCRQMREHLFQQAKLAGVLAVEGKGPQPMAYADNSN